MPVSSKKIITIINSLPHSFTKNELINEIVSPKIYKKTPKKKKKKIYKPKKDLTKIENTLHALTSLEFLTKKKGIYKKNKKLSAQGQIKINSSGNGTVTTEDGDEFIVKEENTKLAHNNDNVSIDIFDYRKGIFYGKVNNITSRHKDRYFAQIAKKTKGIIFYKLIDLPGNVEVSSTRFKDEPDLNDLIILEMTEEILANKPKCKIIQSISKDDEGYDLERIIAKYSLPGQHKDYSELVNIKDNIPKNEMTGRKDYREQFTVTIDGEDAKDFDDAISLEHQNSNFILYVHIADVSAYIQPGTELDKEASKRGTSFYLGNRVIPMIPEKLSNDLCSLKQGKDRLTLSTEITFNSKGSIIDFKYFRGLIKVDKRLTYNIADELIETEDETETSIELKKMYSLAEILKTKRINQGRLDLNLPEEKLIYKNNKIKDLRFAERLKSHSLIEEFMLSANESVSRVLTEKKIPSLHRVHEKISDDSQITLRKFLRQIGIKFSPTGNIGINIQTILEQVKGEEFEQVVNLVVLKSMMQAYYGIEPIGHFGLGFTDYTHFTSPIRRYPDLIVHRCLKSIIDSSEPVYSAGRLERIGEKSSEMERIGQKAERDLIKMKCCRLMEDEVGKKFPAIISGISKFGFFVSLIERPIEGMVPMRYLTDDYYLVMEDDFSVIGKKYGKRFRLGDKIEVKLETVELEKMRIDFSVK